MTSLIDRRRSSNASSVDNSVCRIAQQRVDTCSYAFVFRHVEYEFDDGRLTLRGCVPSFYLIQVLQELLRDIDYVEEIDNGVDVVSSNGLSSERPLKPR